MERVAAKPLLIMAMQHCMVADPGARGVGGVGEVR